MEAQILTVVEHLEQLELHDFDRFCSAALDPCQRAARNLPLNLALELGPSELIPSSRPFKVEIDGAVGNLDGLERSVALEFAFKILERDFPLPFAFGGEAELLLSL